jgi:Tol biopolymer transport system component
MLILAVSSLWSQHDQRSACSRNHQQRKYVTLNEHHLSAVPPVAQSCSTTAATPNVTDLLLAMRLPIDLDMSADGQQVATVVLEYVQGQQKPRRRIWVTGAEQGEVRLFLNGPRDETCPRWSPDGKHLAFITQAEGEQTKPQLHLVAAEGGTPELLCTMPHGVSELAWAPDGRCISFLASDGQEQPEDPQVLQPPRHKRLWTICPHQAPPVVITPAHLTVREYAWAPDSTRLAVYYSEGSEETDWYHSHIGVVASGGGEIHRVVHLSLPARGLAWSPDSQYLAYLSGKWSDPGRGAGDIFLVSLADGLVRNLTPGILCVVLLAARRRRVALYRDQGSDTSGGSARDSQWHSSCAGSRFRYAMGPATAQHDI